MAKKFRMVFTGGGSGGHIFPLVAVAEAVQKTWEGVSEPLLMYYFGPRDSYSSSLEAAGMEIRTVAVGKLRRYFSLQNFLDVPKFFWGFIQALWHFYWIMPDVVFSKGGSGALPVVVAAWWYRIPVAIHESDAKPGLSNVYSARFAKKIFLNFESAADYFDPEKTTVTGLPIRDELLADPLAPAAAKEGLGFSSSHPLVLVIGGSQGAQAINLFIVKNLKTIMDITQVLHQTGPANFPEISSLARATLVEASYENRYRAMGFLDADTMRLALAAADIVVSRASSSVFEFAAFAKPMILIPHPADASNDHQRANAYAFRDAGAARVIEEENLFPGIFMTELKKILGDANIRDAMSNASRSMFLPGAAAVIAGEVLKLAM